MEKVVPFTLESRLIERGAKFEKSGNRQTHVVADQRLITGQSPQSAKAVGLAMLEVLGNREEVVFDEPVSETRNGFGHRLGGLAAEIEFSKVPTIASLPYYLQRGCCPGGT